ncbi:MAG: glycosyltransferase [Blautia sp.]|nr:glycosyltransferase [Blautia sp.]
MCKVSIIVPVYNVENYLRQALDSLKEQTLSDIEVILVNDGSTDGSPVILEEYACADSRFRVIDQPNGGYGKAMNTGISAAAGEYIGILEPDDYVDAHMYEDLYELAEKNDLDFVKSDFCRFKTSEDGTLETEYVSLDSEKTGYGKVFCPAEDPEVFRYKMNTWTGIYRRRWMEEFQIRHNETPGAAFQDNGFYFQTFAYAGRGMIIDKAYYMNRRDNPNSSVKNRGKVYAMNIEYDFLRDMLMRDREVWERFKYFYWWVKYHSYFFTYERIDDKYKKEFMHRMSREYSWAMTKGELSREAFTDLEWKKLQSMIRSAGGFEMALKSAKVFALVKPYVPEWAKRMVFRVLSLRN